MPYNAKPRTTFKKAGKKSAYGYDVASSSSKIFNARQARTDYAATLINPELNLNARIPDLACYPTTTWTSRYSQPITINNADQVANNQLLVFNLNSCPRFNGYNGENRAASAGTGTVGGPTALLTPITIGESLVTLGGKFKAARLVSAMVKMTFAGQDNATEGSIFATYLPTDWDILAAKATWAGGNDICYSSAKWANCPDYYFGPMKNGACVRYKPCDSESFDMRSITVNGSVKDHFGTIAIYVNPSATIAAVTFELEISLNWEGIIFSEITGVPVGISGADPGALAHGLNAAGGSATAFPATPSGWMKNVDTVLRSVT